MAKLKPKTWMTLPQAARHLTDLSESEPVTDIDILQHAIEGDLTLSMRLTKPARLPVWASEIVSEDELTDDEIKAHSRKMWTSATISNEQRQVMLVMFNNKRYLGVRPEMIELLSPGPLCDINPNVESSEYYLNLWNRRQNGEIADLYFCPPTEPRLIKRGDKEIDCSPFLELVSPEISMALSMPIHNIPEGTYLVARPDELQKLIEDKPPAKSTNQISTREKKTYLKVIRALCEDHKDIDLNQHSTAAGQLMAMADALGLAIPSKRTLENMLKEARDLD